MVQTVEELKSIHTLPSLLLFENGVLVHIVEGTSSVGDTSGCLSLWYARSQYMLLLLLQVCHRNDQAESLLQQYASTCCMNVVCVICKTKHTLL